MKATSAPRRGDGLTGAISGTGLVAASRTLREPWATAVALSAPTIAIIWVYLQAIVFEKLDDWREKQKTKRDADVNRRVTAELKAALEEARREVEALGPGEERSKREEQLKLLADEIAGRHVVLLQRRLQADASASPVPRGNSRPRGKAGDGRVPLAAAPRLAAAPTAQPALAQTPDDAKGG